jgi:hypothetical protein
MSRTDVAKKLDSDAPLKTLNVYVPPAYTDEGEDLSAGRA